MVCWRLGTCLTMSWNWPSVGDGADVEFVDSVADAVAAVLGAVGVAGVGGLCHPDAEIARGDLPTDELMGGGSASGVDDGPHGESLPGALVDAVVEGLVLASPELDVVAGGVGVGPGDADGVDVDLGAEIDHDPLGVKGVVVAAVGLGKVRIAFPVGFQVAVGEAGPAVAVAERGAAVGQGIGPGVADLVGVGVGAAGEVALLFGGVAPGAAGIPVPRLDHELGVLAIGDGAPAGAEHFAEDGAGEEALGVFFVFLFSGAAAEAVDGAAEGSGRAERIHDMRRRGIDNDVLRTRGGRQKRASGQHQNAACQALRLL